MRSRLASIAVALVTFVLAAGYVAVTVAGSRIASERVGALVAAIGVAAAFAPLRSRVQRLVDRVFYGERSAPPVVGDHGVAVPQGGGQGRELASVAGSAGGEQREDPPLSPWYSTTSLAAALDVSPVVCMWVPFAGGTFEPLGQLDHRWPG